MKDVIPLSIEISKNEIYIINFKNIMHGYISRRIIPVYEIGRHNDGFIFIIQGECTYTFTDGRCFTAKEGDILYLAKNSKYQMDVKCDKYEFIYFDFEFDTNEDRLSNTYPTKNPWEVKNIFFRLKNNYDNKKGLCTYMADAYKIFDIVCKSKNSAYLSPSTRTGLNDAIKYIRERISDNNLCIGDIAEKLGISEVYLRRLFKAQYGCSPSHYITTLRLETACKMLLSGLFTIEEIAIQNGFNTPSYFTHVFKKEKGIVPSQYKKEM